MGVAATRRAEVIASRSELLSLHCRRLFTCARGKRVMEDAALRSLPGRLGERHVPARPHPESNSHRHPQNVGDPEGAALHQHTFSAFWL